MANDNFPRGLQPLSLRQGDAHYYRCDTAADIFIGEPVDLKATGYVCAATRNGVTPWLGVALGFAGPDKGSIATDDPYLDASDLTTLASGLQSGDRYVLVADNPQQLFLVQEDSSSNLAISSIGIGADISYRGADANVRAGNTDTGWASFELSGSSASTGTNKTLQVLALHETVNSDGTKNAVGNYAKWVVKIVHHRLTGVNIAPLV